MTAIGEWHRLFDAPAWQCGEEQSTSVRYLPDRKVVELRQGPALITIPLDQLREHGERLADFYEELAWWLLDQPDAARTMADYAEAQRDLAQSVTRAHPPG